MNHQILVVDDQESFCNHLRTILTSEGYEVDVSHNADHALAQLSSRHFDILLADMKMPGKNGLELFKLAKKIYPDISGIIMTAYGSISSAVTSVKEGITEYIQKPFEPESLLIAIEKTLKERQMLQEIRDLRKEVDQKYSFSNIIGKNHQMLKIYDLIKRVAPTNARVLITGETGVGKELVAKALHFNSPRKNKAFLGINCGALTETLLESELFGYEKGAFTGAIRTKKGKFEYAHGGTIFLDEIGDISVGMQVKLMRVLQEKKIERVGGNQSIDVNVRIITASNEDLHIKIKRKEFRIELFYRLNVVPIYIPPLRERIEDIPLLAKHFISKLNKNLNRNIRHISMNAMNQLMQHYWPGNVRELENVLERAIVTTNEDTIDHFLFSKDLPDDSRAATADVVDIDIPFPMAKSLVLNRFEKAYLFEALKRYNGNVSLTAKKTEINPRTLFRKIKSYGLNSMQFKAKKRL